MKYEDIQIGEIYWLDFKSELRGLHGSYHGRFLVERKAREMAWGKTLDEETTITGLYAHRFRPMAEIEALQRMHANLDKIYTMFVCAGVVGVLENEVFSYVVGMHRMVEERIANGSK